MSKFAIVYSSLLLVLGGCNAWPGISARFNHSIDGSVAGVVRKFWMNEPESISAQIIRLIPAQTELVTRRMQLEQIGFSCFETARVHCVHESEITYVTTGPRPVDGHKERIVKVVASATESDGRIDVKIQKTEALANGGK